jgi:hypothetical protein
MAINTRGGVRGDIHTYTPPRGTLAATSSRPKPETLAVREVLAHLRATFHLCMCGLYGDIAVVAAALIGCDDMEVAVGTTTFSTPTRDYDGSLL